MYTIKTPVFIPWIFYDCLWKIPTTEKEIFLTFDDGPTPYVTEQVLELLQTYKAKATFFCVGAQIEKNKDLFKRIVREGHAIGNHTYTHLHGWYCAPKRYLQEIEDTSNLIQQLAGFRPSLFRPPYGKFSPSTKKSILAQYRMVMWDVLAGDFDPLRTPHECITGVLRSYQKGSIIVLHDSHKSGTKLLQILPPLLKHFAQNEIKMSPIPILIRNNV